MFEVCIAKKISSGFLVLKVWRTNSKKISPYSSNPLKLSRKFLNTHSYVSFPSCILFICCMISSFFKLFSVDLRKEVWLGSILFSVNFFQKSSNFFIFFVFTKIFVISLNEYETQTKFGLNNLNKKNK